jgi:hypothetical protein
VDEGALGDYAINADKLVQIGREKLPRGEFVVPKLADKPNLQPLCTIDQSYSFNSLFCQLEHRSLVLATPEPPLATFSLVEWMLCWQCTLKQDSGLQCT